MSKDILIVRHGRSIRDCMRETVRSGGTFNLSDYDDPEGLVNQGYVDSRNAGDWIRKHLIENDTETVSIESSGVSRSCQSAQAMAATLGNLAVLPTVRVNRHLIERRRGKIAGLSKFEHETIFPESYQEMCDNPIDWIPPEGESLRQTGERASAHLGQAAAKMSGTLIISGHRDWTWSWILSEFDYDEERAENSIGFNSDNLTNNSILQLSSDSDNQSVSKFRLIDPLAENSNPVGEWVYLYSKH